MTHEDSRYVSRFRTTADAIRRANGLLRDDGTFDNVAIAFFETRLGELLADAGEDPELRALRAYRDYHAMWGQATALTAMSQAFEAGLAGRTDEAAERYRRALRAFNEAGGQYDRDLEHAAEQVGSRLTAEQTATAGGAPDAGAAGDSRREVALARPCTCGGVFLPAFGTAHLDTDGSATVDTQCSQCDRESVAYFAWNAPDDEDCPSCDGQGRIYTQAWHEYWAHYDEVEAAWRAEHPGGVWEDSVADLLDEPPLEKIKECEDCGGTGEHPVIVEAHRSRDPAAVARRDPAVLDNPRLTPDQTLRAASDAIGLFLEYRDQHGYDEDVARLHALGEVSDGITGDILPGADTTRRDAVDARPADDRPSAVDRESAINVVRTSIEESDLYPMTGDRPRIEETAAGVVDDLLSSGILRDADTIRYDMRQELRAAVGAAVREYGFEDADGVDLVDVGVVDRVLAEGTSALDRLRAEREQSGRAIEAAGHDRCSTCDGRGVVLSPAWREWYDREDDARKGWGANHRVGSNWSDTAEAKALDSAQPDEPVETSCTDCDGARVEPVDAMTSMVTSQGAVTTTEDGKRIDADGDPVTPVIGRTDSDLAPGGYDPKGSEPSQPMSAPAPTADLDRAVSQEESAEQSVDTATVDGDSPGPVHRAQRAVLELKGRRALEKQYARARDDRLAGTHPAETAAGTTLNTGRGPVLSAFDD